jgi:hypothetical protein
MKLVCINNIQLEDILSVGKIYDFIKMTDGDDSAYFLVRDDNGDSWPFVFNGANKLSRDRWISLEEYREQKLNKIL